VENVASSVEHTDPLTSNRGMLIGVYYDKISAPIDGKIEFLRIWERALTTEEHLAWHRRLA